MFAKLKNWRRIAMRFDRRAHAFMSAIQIAPDRGGRHLLDLTIPDPSF